MIINSIYPIETFYVHLTKQCSYFCLGGYQGGASAAVCLGSWYKFASEDGTTPRSRRILQIKQKAFAKCVFIVFIAL